MDVSLWLKLVGFLKWPWEWLSDWLAIRVEQHVHGLEPPTLVITILNRSKSLPLHVENVRFCIGLPEAGYSWAISALPSEKVTIAPLTRAEFVFPMVGEVSLRRTTLSKFPPKLDRETGEPPYRHQLDFARAMTTVPSKQAWLEVDYNEHDRRVFMRGKIQNLLPPILQKIDADIEKARPKAAEKGITLDHLTAHALSNKAKRATLLLPTGIMIDLEDFEFTIADVIACAREVLGDPAITPQGFGISNHFFFVNNSRGALIDSILDLDRPLSTLVQEGSVIELRLCKPHPLPDGTVLNPMRGVTRFVR